MSEYFKPSDIGRRAQHNNIFEKYGRADYSVYIEGFENEHIETINLSIVPGEVLVIISDVAEARASLIDVIADKGAGHNCNFYGSNQTKVTLIESETYEDSKSIRDFFLESRNLDGTETRLLELYGQIDQHPEVAREMSELQERMDFNNGWGADSEIAQILGGLSIESSSKESIKPDNMISEVSSGQFVKLALGKALYSKSDIVLLKDSDIHLDVPSRDWLISYIQGTKQALAIATSDMITASEVATHVLEVLSTRSYISVQGGMKTFEREKERIIREWISESDSVKDNIEHLKKDVARLRQAAQNSETLARRKDVQEAKLQKLEELYNGMPGTRLTNSERQIKKLNFEIDEPGSQNVVSSPIMEVEYKNSPDKKIVLPGIDIFKGQRLAIVGLNGTGKSTLLKVLFNTNPEEIVSNEPINIGPSVKYSWYNPKKDVPINSELTLRSFFAESKSKKSPGLGEVMDYWGIDKKLMEMPLNFKFSRDVSSRILMAKMMLEKSNLLVLDEPTSHLSPKYKQRLIDALIDYKGTLITVSHDIAFLNGIGIDHVIEMPEGSISTI